jgi:hypothetical protein
MTDGFAKHNIDHLSASSINLYANAPDVWVVSYLFGRRTPMGPAPWRGICVEDAVVQILMGDSEAAAIDQALEKFDKRFPIGDEKTSAERRRIQPMAQLAIEELVEFGKPEFPEDEEHPQEKISITAKGEGWSIPVIGYLDLVFPQHGVVIDLKTTGRIPSTMSAEHQLQRAIYAKAKGNMAVRFLYVSEKKTACWKTATRPSCWRRPRCRSPAWKHSCGTATRTRPGRSCRCSPAVSTGKARKICAKNSTASKP